MTNIKDMTQNEVNQHVENTQKLYAKIIELIESGKIVPTIQAKHERVYIRPAVVGERIDVPADKASYIAVEGQYVVYNDAKNRYLVNEKAFKRYALDENLMDKKDQDSLEIKGYKPKGLPQLVVSVKDLEEHIDLVGLTYFPSGWWGSSNTIEEGAVMILPFQSDKSLSENVKMFKEAFDKYPKAGTNKEDVAKHLESGEGFDCYAIDKGHVHTYAICDKNGTFKDSVLKAKANQTEKYLGQNLGMGKKFE